jgi:UrcA family protein
MTPNKTATAFVIASAAGLLLPAAALAQTDDTVVQGQRGDLPVAYVQYRDINLGNAEGVGKLRARGRRVADAICVEHGVTSLSRRVSGLHCKQTAITSAEPQIARVVARFRDGDLAALQPIGLRGAD